MLKSTHLYNITIFSETIYYKFCKIKNQLGEWYIMIEFNQVSSYKSIPFAIVSEIKDKLLEGALKPGDKLPTENQLAEQFQVSRTPIREAMKILEAIGVIEIKRGEGMFITNRSSEFTLNALIFSLILHNNELYKLIEFRQHFEIMLLNMIITNWTEDKINNIEQVYLSQVERINHNLSPQELADIDLEFHYALLEATENPFVIEIGKTLYELYRPKMISDKQSPGIERMLETHKIRLETLKERKIISTIDQIINMVENNKEWLEE